jgi:Leucine-rich repeat (LRR) protein
VLTLCQSQNRLANNCLEVISQISPLRDLKLGGNLLYGPLDPCFSKLENLEILDLHGNNIASLPTNFGNISRLRILNISENAFEILPFEILASMPLTEVNARKNQLKGTLVPESVEALPTLQNLDVSSNQLSHICSPTGSVAMPALRQVCLSMNRLQSLPDISTWVNLLTLAADENNINAIPEGFTGLEQLRSVDFSSNDIRVVPNEVGRMENLAMLRLSGNPLREKKFSTMNTDDLKSILAQRLEPPPSHLEPKEAPLVSGDATDEGTADIKEAQPAASGSKSADAGATDDMDDSRSDDDFATPPTSIPGSPARSRSHTLSNQLWPVKPGGVLDRSNTQSSSLHPVVSSKVAANHKVYEIQLHHNLFTALPDSLTFFADTLSALSLAHNQLVGETYMGGLDGNQGLDLPSLKELNLASNHITSLGPLLACLRAPQLQKLDVSCNRIAALPKGTQIKDTFPNLTVLLMANNHLAELDPDAIKGMRIVDAGNNDIAHLNPRIGLLGGAGGLERLEVGGNRFRVPRFNVLERGTEATLRWLRGRVPVAEMAAWKGEDGDEHDTSVADLD